MSLKNKLNKLLGFPKYRIIRSVKDNIYYYHAQYKLGLFQDWWYLPDSLEKDITKTQQMIAGDYKLRVPPETNETTVITLTRKDLDPHS